MSKQLMASIETRKRKGEIVYVLKIAYLHVYKNETPWIEERHKIVFPTLALAIHERDFYIQQDERVSEF